MTKTREQGPEVLLFDADGVLQQPSVAWEAALAALLDSGDDVEGFVTAVFAAETPSLTGDADFAASLGEVLDAWGCSVLLEDALKIWTSISVDSGLLELVGSLRADGLRCCLVSNQNPCRARHMSEVLAYRTVFDAEFYSCHLGCRKPEPAFFETVVTHVGVPPARTLLIDDDAANVTAATCVGDRRAAVRPRR